MSEEEVGASLIQSLSISEALETDTPRALMARLKLLYPEFEFTKDHIREAIQAHKRDEVLDGAVRELEEYPTDRVTGRGVYTHVQFLLMEQDRLMDVLRANDFPVLQDGDDIELFREDIVKALTNIGSALVSVRKDTLLPKAVDSGGINLNISLDKQISSAVSRIDAAREEQATIIDAVLESENE